MHPSPRHRGHRGASSAAVAAIVILLVGVAVVFIGVRDGQTPANTTTAASSETAERAHGAGRTTAGTGPDTTAAPGVRPNFGRTLPGSPPVALAIPSIGVRAGTIVYLGLAGDGTIEVPNNPDTPGWFTPGPSPGQVGPAVIAGHVDSMDGPAVFARLGELRRGERIHVTREDGSTATFAVRKVETYNKDAFPTRAVYGTTDRAALRLITCSGDYDVERGYLANTVVYAYLL
jgi:hypothetical protein